MIQNILAMLGVAQQPAQLDPIDLFLAGHSIPAISASAGMECPAKNSGASNS